MMLSDLHEIIEGMLEDGDREVRIASQESWPFENSIRGIVDGQDLDVSDEQKECVYIVEGRQLGYFTKDAWSNC